MPPHTRGAALATTGGVKTDMRPSNRFLLCLVICSTLLMPGCAFLRPVALSDHEIGERAKQDLDAIRKGGEPVAGPVTVYSAMARALQYNLDHRLEMARKTVSAREFDLSRLDMLPDLVAGARPPLARLVRGLT